MRGDAHSRLGGIHGRANNIKELIALAKAQPGKLKLLASSAEARTVATPDTPTMAEAGVPGYESIAWFALVGPAGLPRPIVDSLNRESAAMQKSRAAIDTFAKAGAEMLPGSPDQLAARIRRELPRFAKIRRFAMEARVPRRGR